MEAGSHAGMALGVLAALCLFCVQPSVAAQHVDDFTLPDQNGKLRKLHGLSDRKAVVVVVQGNGCPIVRKAWNSLREVRAGFSGKDVAFLMLNPNLQDDRAAIQSEAREFGYDIPILVDATQRVGEALGVIRTAEVFLIDTKTWNVAYRGPIDDRLTYERQRAAANETYLIDALGDVLSGKPVAVAKRDSPGCIVNFPDRDESVIFPGNQATAPTGGRHEASHDHHH